MPRRILSLDFRDDALAAAVLRQTMREILVEDWAVVPLEGDGSGPERWEAALAVLFERVSAADAVCVAGFPPRWAAYRFLRVPFANARKIRQILAYELEPLLPHTADETVADFVLGASSPGEQGRQLIAAATTRERVDRFLGVLSGAGLKARALPLGVHAAAQCLSDAGGLPASWLLVDADRNNCHFAFVAGGRLEHVGSLPEGLGGEWDADAAAAALLRSLAALEVRSAVAPQPETVLLAGAASSDEAVRTALGEAFRLPVEPLRLEARYPKLRFSTVPDRERGGSLQVALALGLAEALRLEPLQLRQGAFAESGLLSRHRGRAIRSAALVLLALAVFSAGFVADGLRKRRHHERLQAQVEEVFRTTFPEARRVVDPVAQMQVNLREARESIRRAGIQEPGVRTLDVIAEISRRVPPQLDLLLTRLDVTADSALMAGDTGTFNTVDEVKRRLEQSPLFREVTINSTAKSKSGERVEFKMTIGL